MTPEIVQSLGLLVAVSLALPYAIGWPLGRLFTRGSVDRLFLSALAPGRVVGLVGWFAAAGAVFHYEPVLRAWRDPPDPLLALPPLVAELFRGGRSTAAEVVLCYAAGEALACLVLARLSLGLMVMGMLGRVPFRKPLG